MIDARSGDCRTGQANIILRLRSLFRRSLRTKGGLSCVVSKRRGIVVSLENREFLTKEMTLTGVRRTAAIIVLFHERGTCGTECLSFDLY